MRGNAMAGKLDFPEMSRTDTEIAMKALNILLATALLATGGAAAAQTASDAQCLVLSNAYAGQAKDAEAKEIAEASL